LYVAFFFLFSFCVRLNSFCNLAVLCVAS
jgi:hypothetical protein